MTQFVRAHPKPNPTTPLGPNWNFTPCFLPDKYKSCVDELENFEIRPDDIFSITFPKSGSTWSQEMIWLLNNDLNYEAAKQKFLDRFPQLEIDICFNGIFLNNLERLRNTPSPRHIKSHLPAGLLPQLIWTVKPKIIYVTRGVKDAAVSYYHHYKLFQNYQGSMQDFLDAFFEDEVNFSPHRGHIRDFWHMRGEEIILILSFEEMKDDTMSVLKRTAEFLGKNYSDDELRQLEKHLSFDAMKSNNAVNKETERLSAKSYFENQQSDFDANYFESGR